MKVTKKRKTNHWVKLFFLHRYIGISIALFVIMLSVTGILLNHTDTLELHKRPVNNTWLMKWYGVQSPDIQHAYQLKNNLWVTEFADHIYLNQQQLACQAPLKGAVMAGEMIIIAHETTLCLFTVDGQLIDSLTLDTKKNPSHQITRMGYNKGTEKTILIDTSMGLLTINADYTALVSLSDTPTYPQWQQTQTPPKNLSITLKNQHQGSGLSLERILLDLHSGRIMTQQGVYFMDLVALLLIFIAISGVVMWIRPLLRKRKRRR